MYSTPDEKETERQDKHPPRRIELHLHGGGKISLYSGSPDREIGLRRLGELMCMATEPGTPEKTDLEFVPHESLPSDRHTIWSTGMTEAAFSPDWDHMLLAGWKKVPGKQNCYQNNIWQTGLIFAVMNAILRGERAVLVHCTVLEKDRGAVVVFGESGMGKSTASARWRAQGGKCISDDMALLDFSGGDTIYVRRMPTWSACREGKNEWTYPAGEELPLISVLALGRSEGCRDEIVELSPAQYFAQCYRSMFYWNLVHAGHLPEGMQSKLTERIRDFTEIVTKRFPSRALMTVLEGDQLRSVVEDYLQTQ